MVAFFNATKGLMWNELRKRKKILDLSVRKGKKERRKVK